MIKDKRQACTIEITEEMIRAGANVLYNHYEEQDPIARRLAKEIFCVMLTTHLSSSAELKS
jgi:hypothetical protein